MLDLSRAGDKWIGDATECCKRLTRAAVIAFETACSVRVWRTAYIRSAPLNQGTTPRRQPGGLGAQIPIRPKAGRGPPKRLNAKTALPPSKFGVLVGSPANYKYKKNVWGSVSSHLASHSSTSSLSAACCHNHNHPPFPRALQA